jgi:hypothetical protein
MECNAVTSFNTIFCNISRTVDRNIWRSELLVFLLSSSKNSALLKASLKAPNVSVRFVAPDNGLLRLKMFCVYGGAFIYSCV